MTNAFQERKYQSVLARRFLSGGMDVIIANTCSTLSGSQEFTFSSLPS
jgi:hypothetical protein